VQKEKGPNPKGKGREQTGDLDESSEEEALMNKLKKVMFFYSIFKH